MNSVEEKRSFIRRHLWTGRRVGCCSLGDRPGARGRCRHRLRPCIHNCRCSCGLYQSADRVARGWPHAPGLADFGSGVTWTPVVDA